MSIRNGRKAYKSPIETIWSDIEHESVERFDQMVLTAVQSVVIRVNKEELVKALAYDREQYRKGWEDRDSEIVRCWDCKHSQAWYRDKLRCFMWSETGIDVFEDGYCSYGERKGNEAD